MIPMVRAWLHDMMREWGCTRCQRMHRRAQEAESKAARVLRQNDHAVLWETVHYLRRWRERDRANYIREKKYRRALVERIHETGLVERQSERFPEYREGNLDVLVERLIAKASGPVRDATEEP